MLFLFRSICSLETSSWRCVLKAVCSEPWSDGTSTLEGALHHMLAIPLVEHRPWYRPRLSLRFLANYRTLTFLAILYLLLLFVWDITSTGFVAFLLAAALFVGFLGSLYTYLRGDVGGGEEGFARGHQHHPLPSTCWLMRPVRRKNFEQSFLQPLELCSITYDKLGAHSHVPQYLNSSSFCALNECRIEII